MMKIICNGESKDITTNTTVEQFVKEMGIEPDTVVVECNGQILKRGEYDSHALEDGAVLELIRFVGGG